MNDSLCLYHHWKMTKNGNVMNVVLSVEVKVQSVKPAILLNQCGHVWKHVSVTQEENHQAHHQFVAVDRRQKKTFTIEQDL